MPLTHHRSLVARLFRPGETDARAVRIDLFWLIGLALLLIATGIGLRDPWPADEPRFALVARDMVATHQWLIPHVGGDVYADKPPFFFWLIALGLTLTGSLRLAFLLPSLLAGVGCVVLIYDLARRLWNREVGLAAALALLFCVQFVWQARQAQIDATLCFFTTLGLYGLLRHCLLGPDWKWYTIGWAAAGLGIITKGVGFLPLLVLIPYAFARGGWQPRPVFDGGWRWALGPVALLVTVGLWLVPMLIAAEHNSALQAYRDEILFGQTVGRYTQAWHHREPFWYFLVEVIPLFWMPLVALLPWLIPGWRELLRRRDLRVFLPLAWTVLVVLFFSFSSGKRGVYVLPALPALALAAGPLLAAIAQRRAAQRTLFVITAVVAVLLLGAAAYVLMHGAQRRQEIIDLYDIDVLLPLILLGVAAVIACLIARPRRGMAAWSMMLGAELLIVSFVVVPQIDGARSGKDFMRKVESMTVNDPELGLVGYEEEYLLQLRRPVTNFGHARWREAGQEAADAAAWLASKPQRVLLVDEYARDLCFKSATTREAGIASRERWFLVSGRANPDCVRRGRLDASIDYRPPTVAPR